MTVTVLRGRTSDRSPYGARGSELLGAALGEMRAGVDPHLDEGALVAEQVEPLTGCELAALVLLGDLLLAAAEPRLGAALVQLRGQVGQRGGAGQQVRGFLLGRHRSLSVLSTAGRVSRRRR